MRDLEGKLALVTGGAKNVGKVIARRLSERGADVIINYHSGEVVTCTGGNIPGFQAKTVIDGAVRQIFPTQAV